jgi:hypothetical protein
MPIGVMLLTLTSSPSGNGILGGMIAIGVPLYKVLVKNREICRSSPFFALVYEISYINHFNEHSVA